MSRSLVGSDSLQPSSVLVVWLLYDNDVAACELTEHKRDASIIEHSSSTSVDVAIFAWRGVVCSLSRCRPFEDQLARPPRSEAVGVCGERLGWEVTLILMMWNDESVLLPVVA